MSAASADNRITEKVQTDGINITKDHVKMVFCVGKSYKIGIIVSNIDYNTYTKYNRSMERNLYHGSKTIIEKPIFGFGNIHNDYGLGFYCCGNKNLAREWAVRKNDEGILNKYTLRDDRLKIIDLTQGEYSNILIWISLLVKNRSDFMELQKNFWNKQ